MPKDSNQLAHRIVQIATGQEPEPEPEQLTPIQEAARAMGRVGGVKGGRARADGMTAQERSEAAHKAAKARWTKQKQ